MHFTTPPLADPFGRRITYLRLSVTDRCDLRCTYCMAEKMQFLPKRELLTLEELDRLASQFIALGVKKLRLTGGEPLVRRDVLGLMDGLSRHLVSGALEELTLTTNGTLLAEAAPRLAAMGVRRINVSLDTLDAERYRTLTRGGALGVVLEGIAAAKRAGLAVKINTVALRDDPLASIQLIEWAHKEGFDLTLIEAMPMGDTGEDRQDQYLPLTVVQESLAARWTLTPLADRTGGPARYWRVEETGGRLGMITPLTNNFCDGCNRVRLTCTGRLYQCLGQDQSADFRQLMRDGADDDALREAIAAAISHKPWGHDFDYTGSNSPAVERHMSVTGG